MVRRFKSILVPVDFSKNTDLAVAKALSMCSGDGCILHLLHVQQIWPGNAFKCLQLLLRGYSWRFLKTDMNKSENKLINLKHSIEAGEKRVKVYISVCYGESIEDTISRKAIDLSVDLVVLGKRSSHFRLPNLNTVKPSRVALNSGIPVLTAKPGSLNNSVKKVVIPIGIDLPVNKLAITEALQHQSGLETMLVVFPYDKTRHSFSKQTLLNTFRILKSLSGNPVRYEVLKGKNRARALVNYCIRSDADILVVYPGSETRVSSWVNSHISDMLPASSRTQVLAVKPE